MKKMWTEEEMKKVNEFVSKFGFSPQDSTYSDIKSGLSCGAVLSWIFNNFELKRREERKK